MIWIGRQCFVSDSPIDCSALQWISRILLGQVAVKINYNQSEAFGTEAVKDSHQCAVIHWAFAPLRVFAAAPYHSLGYIRSGQAHHYFRRKVNELRTHVYVCLIGDIHWAKYQLDQFLFTYYGVRETGKRLITKTCMDIEPYITRTYIKSTHCVLRI